jgi:hypothetical protein
MDNKNDVSVKALTIRAGLWIALHESSGFSLRDGLQVWEQRGVKSRANAVHRLESRFNAQRL